MRRRERAIDVACLLTWLFLVAAVIAEAVAVSYFVWKWVR